MKITISVLIGFILCALLLLPGLIKKKRYDYDRLKEYEYDREKAIELMRQAQEEALQAQDEEVEAKVQLFKVLNEKDTAEASLKEILDNEAIQRANIANLIKLESDIKKNMEKSIEEKTEALHKEYLEAELAHAEEYKIVMLDAVEDFNKEWNKNIDELNEIKKQIEDKRQIFEAILADEQRKNKEANFYSLNISSEDSIEIAKIQEISPLLRNPEVLNKVLWTAYYQKPYQDLIMRLFNSSKPSGIYKITCIPNGKIYVGQSVNVPNRFSEHIKRGLGAEPATRNRLYIEMKTWGVENFLFELLEEVPREKLDERERFWIEYFHSAEIGLNGNKGVKA